MPPVKLDPIRSSFLITSVYAASLESRLGLAVILSVLYLTVAAFVHVVIHNMESNSQVDVALVRLPAIRIVNIATPSV